MSVVNEKLAVAAARRIDPPGGNGVAREGKTRGAGDCCLTERAEDLAFRSLLRTLGLIERVMHPYFANFGITGSQWGVLRALDRAEADGLPGLRLTDLSERLVIRPPSVTGVIDRLERLGLVKRLSVPGDLRVKQVTLTAKARQVLQRILCGHAGQIDSVLGGLSSGDQQDLHRLLAKLNSHLEEMADAEEV
ncbi:MAG TPA: MarR family transcriptional regulator [Tepidisphaeraceae bacterium]|jgi:DNA-binding MarR family transcriptional regulator|nr:MarR family transcriptional regulator [Tepidisphaeraceae bacterium]